MSRVTLLAIPGSLRAGSSNTALLRAAAALAPPEVEVVLYQALADLPHFNPDLDLEGSVPPKAVAALRALVAQAHGYLISTPEYAHGVPGALKNALDWLVSFAPFAHKPVALVNASPSGGAHAHASLVEILTTMSAVVLPEASLLMPFSRSKLDANGDVANPGLREALARCVATLARQAAPERPGKERC